MGEFEIAELCQRIYQKHQRALDLIYEYRPDRQAIIQEILQKIIKQAQELVLDSVSKTNIYFARKEWDRVDDLLKGSGWTRSRRILLFQFRNGTDSLILRLYIGPGPQEIRQHLFDGVLTSLPSSNKAIPKKLYGQYCSIYSRTFLSVGDYEDKSDKEIEEEIHKQWAQFVEKDLPLIAVAVRGWIR